MTEKISIYLGTEEKKNDNRITLYLLFVMYVARVTVKNDIQTVTCVTIHKKKKKQKRAHLIILQIFQTVFLCLRHNNCWFCVFDTCYLQYARCMKWMTLVRLSQSVNLDLFFIIILKLSAIHVNCTG